MVQESAIHGYLQRSYAHRPESTLSSLATALTTEEKRRPKWHRFGPIDPGQTVQQSGVASPSEQTMHLQLTRRHANLLRQHRAMLHLTQT